MKTKILLLGFALAAMTATAQIPTNGLVGYYPFNGNANDATNNANNGTVNGATLTTDRFGNANSAYSFDGQSNYIEIPHSSAFNSKLISIGFWSKFSFAATSLGGGPNVNPAIISKLPNQVPIASIDWVFYEIGGGINCSGNISGTVCCMNDGLWKFNLISVGIDSARFYVNGLKVSTIAVGGINNTTNPIRIGRSLNTYWKGFNGVVDDIVIYNRALTPTEITQLYTGKVDTCFVTVHDTVHISVTDTLVINAKLTGVNPPNNMNAIKVFPNPTKDHITINTGTYSLMNGYSIKITNTLGQTVFQSPINQQQFDVDLSSWSGTGTYIISIIDKQSNVVDTRKIILQ